MTSGRIIRDRISRADLATMAEGQGNRSLGVDDESIRARIREVAESLVSQE